MHIKVSEINAFCRQKDLVFVEEGAEKSQLVLWFLDFKNNPISFSEVEVSEAIKETTSHKNKIVFL